jgi:hypothetical protein
MLQTNAPIINKLTDLRPTKQEIRTIKTSSQTNNQKLGLFFDNLTFPE